MTGERRESGKVGSIAYALVLVGIALSGLASIAFLNFTIDPLQRFRPATFYPPAFSDQQRLQGPALARSHDYDAVVTGSSTAEHVFAADAREILGISLLRLPVSGGTLREQRMQLEVALSTGKPKRIIWFIDSFALTTNKDLVREDFGPFPHFMYAGGIEGLSKYLLNFNILGRSLDILVDIATGQQKTSVSLDRLNAWNERTEFSAEMVFEAYHDLRLQREWRRVIGTRMSTQHATAAATIEANIVLLARSHPKVIFDLVLVPASIAQLAYWSALFPELYEAILAARTALIAQTADLSNIRIRDFQSFSQVTHDFSRYSDLIHFDLATTREILYSLDRDERRVSNGEIAATEALIRSQVSEFLTKNPLATAP